jgi:hypothetical protein
MLFFKCSGDIFVHYERYDSSWERPYDGWDKSSDKPNSAKKVPLVKALEAFGEICLLDGISSRGICRPRIIYL